VQSSHALIDFILKYPADALMWHKDSNYLAQLSVPDEDALYKLLEKARARGIKVVPFFEPDLNNQLTAICLEPTEESRKLTSSLPLMLKDKQEAKIAA
jgi:uncharacterized lipoprotein YddW (UPF0748 family)